MSLLTVIVPVFNERETVGRTLELLAELPLELQILVVDDGSTDGTAEVLAEWERAGVEVLGHEHNRGKGAAIRTGLTRARGAYTLIQDADAEYDPRDIPKLLEPLRAGTADVVYGSRYLNRENDLSGRMFLNGGVRLLNLAVRLWYGVWLTDEATCYKLFPTELLRGMDLQCERFEFCPEVTAKACRLGARIVEVPIRYHGRSAWQGKKLRLRDGLSALATLWRWRKWHAAADGGLAPLDRSHPSRR